MVGKVFDYVASLGAWQPHGPLAGQPFDQAMAGKGRSFDASKPASQNQAQGKPMGQPVSCRSR